MFPINEETHVEQCFTLELTAVQQGRGFFVRTYAGARWHRSVLLSRQRKGSTVKGRCMRWWQKIRAGASSKGLGARDYTKDIAAAGAYAKHANGVLL